MADQQLPYVTAYGNIEKALERIKTAQTPPRFTQDFLATKLNLKGGSARPVIPFLKRSGFLGSDGSPTELYKRFRSDAQRGGAAREALKTAYKPLYEINEYVHDAKDSDLKGIVLQATGLEAGSSTVQVDHRFFQGAQEAGHVRRGRPGGCGGAAQRRARRRWGDRPPRSRADDAVSAWLHDQPQPPGYLGHRGLRRYLQEPAGAHPSLSGDA